MRLFYDWRMGNNDIMYMFTVMKSLNSLEQTF